MLPSRWSSSESSASYEKDERRIPGVRGSGDNMFCFFNVAGSLPNEKPVQVGCVGFKATGHVLVGMLRERNTFVLKARSGCDERQHAITLQVSLREHDLRHFNGTNGAGGARTIEVMT